MVYWSKYFLKEAHINTLFHISEIISLVNDNSAGNADTLTLPVETLFKVKYATVELEDYFLDEEQNWPQSKHAYSCSTVVVFSFILFPFLCHVPLKVPSLHCAYKNQINSEQLSNIYIYISDTKCLLSSEPSTKQKLIEWLTLKQTLKFVLNQALQATHLQT